MQTLNFPLVDKYFVLLLSDPKMLNEELIINQYCIFIKIEWNELNNRIID